MSQADEIVVRQLQLVDDRTWFRSGNIELDRFFQRFAGQNQFRHHVGATWIAVRGDSIVGFVTISAAHQEVTRLPERLRRGLPAYPLPVLRLSRMAVSVDAQGKGIGRLLLRTVFAMAWRMARDFGCIGVVVDAKSDAIGFYDRLGFFALEPIQGGLGDRPEPTPMFIPLRDIPEATESL